jgi:hypothetical protein
MDKMKDGGKSKEKLTDLSRTRSATSLIVSIETAPNAWQATSQTAATTCFRTFSS